MATANGLGFTKVPVDEPECPECGVAVQKLPGWAAYHCADCRADLDVALRRIRGSNGPEVRRYLVIDAKDGSLLGMIAKQPNSRTEIHPWKAWAGTGFDAQFLDSYFEDHYPNEDAPTAKAAAIEAAIGCGP